MTILEDAIRDALRAEAQALRVPERPALNRETVEVRRRPGPRWLAAAACLALVVAGVVALALRRVSDTEPAPPVASVVPDTTARPFLGTWVSTDIFGGTSTMMVEASEDDSVEMLVTDFARVCSGASTMTGSGRLQTDTQLVFPAPVLTCDDGSQPESLNGPSLEEALQNLTFSRDPVTDILTDNFGYVWTRKGTDLGPTPTSPPAEAALTELLNGFLEARLAGDGAQQYLNVPDDDIPLLYSTTSGAPYERAEFEQVTGIEWPYGFTAFKVRLFSEATVVEQLFFTPVEGRLGLEYQPDGFGTDIAPTTEDGQPVAVAHAFFDGQVTVEVAHPWIFGGPFGRLIPDEPVGPTTDGGQRIAWDEFFLIADPTLLGTGCRVGQGAADAEALAESIRSNPDLGATAPVAVSVGGAEALMMDVAIAAGATVCAPASSEGELLDTGLLNPIFDDFSRISYDRVNRVVTGSATGELMRLYLIDAPEGSSMQILAIAIVAPAPRLERAAEAAAPIVDSIQFHAP